MGLLDSLRRSWRDSRTQDEYIDGTPQEHLRRINHALPQMTPQERQKNLEQLKAYTDYYYVGHQREQVPPEMKQAYNQLSKEAERLNTVDQAREILRRHGGPPSAETVADSLERSAKQREQIVERSAPKQREMEMSHTAEMSL